MLITQLYENHEPVIRILVSSLTHQDFMDWQPRVVSSVKWVLQLLKFTSKVLVCVCVYWGVCFRGKSKRESQHREFEMCFLLWRETVHAKKKTTFGPQYKNRFQAKVKKNAQKTSGLSHVPEETTIMWTSLEVNCVHVHINQKNDIIKRYCCTEMKLTKGIKWNIFSNKS